jgi:hypothetical protein
VTEDDTPLFFIGVCKLGNFSDEAHVWMYFSKFFTRQHLRMAKSMWCTWLAKQEDTKFLAHCQSRDAGRFLEFNGFEYKYTHNGVLTYEVIKWQ